MNSQLTSLVVLLALLPLFNCSPIDSTDNMEEISVNITGICRPKGGKRWELYQEKHSGKAIWYHLSNWGDSTRKWWDQEEYCRGADNDGRSTMATIKDSKQQKFIRPFVAATGNWHWIGGVRLGQRKLFWYTDIEDREPETIVEEIDDYAHWQSGEPDNSGETQNCVAMYPDTEGHWYDQHCEDNSMHVVCELRC